MKSAENASMSFFVTADKIRSANGSAIDHISSSVLPLIKVFSKYPPFRSVYPMLNVEVRGAARGGMPEEKPLDRRPT